MNLGTAGQGDGDRFSEAQNPQIPSDPSKVSSETLARVARALADGGDTDLALKYLALALVRHEEHHRMIAETRPDLFAAYPEQWIQ